MTPSQFFLDDIRPAPPGIWHHALTGEAAIAYLDDHAAELTLISLDHDLGLGLSGYDVVCHLEKLHSAGALHPDVQVFVHSANPVGIERMCKVLEKMFSKSWKTFAVDYISFCNYLRDNGA